jgi:O-antigen ligase
VLPFEPRHPAFSVAGLRVTWLEAVAAAASATLLWSFRHRVPGLLRGVPRPWVFLALYAAAHLLSALAAPAHRDLGWKFALRMSAMATFALAVAAAPWQAWRQGLVALAAGAGIVAVLAVLETAGARFIDPLLDCFREIPFNVAGSRRASAGSEYPNLAGAFLMYGMLAVAGLASSRRDRLLLAVSLSGLLAAGLLGTYSRGALLAAGLGLLVLVMFHWRAERRLAPSPSLAFLVLAATSTVAYRGEIFRLRLESEGTRSWYGAHYEPEERQLTLAPGESLRTRVRITNRGLKTWTVDGAFHLSYHWYDQDRRLLEDGPRTVLPRDLRPGESALLEAEVKAPGGRGRYLLVWDMVHEHTAWFSGQGVTPAAVPVDVAAGGAPSGPVTPDTRHPPTSLAWRPSRAELWSLALTMWRDRPLTGVGPDNFRWLHGPRAGRDFWDTRVFANNTLLEAAATTGTIGLLALAATLASALGAAWRRARAEPAGSPQRGGQAALLALTVGLLAHGTVDYTLAFTGHYLLFGFVVGALSSPPAPASEVAS